METGRPVSRGITVTLAAAAVLSFTGCNFQDVPPLDAPVLELRASSTSCMGLWHMPNRNFAGSLSWGLYAVLVETEDGSEVPELDGATISVDGLPDARASVDADGVVVGVLPFTGFGNYPISGIGVSLPDGTEYSISVSYDFTVDADAVEVTCDGDPAESETIERAILVSPLVDF